MYKSFLNVTPGHLRVFIACLLAIAILTTPIAAISAPRSVGNPTARAGDGKADPTNGLPATTEQIEKTLTVSNSTCDNAPVVTTNADSGTGSLRQAIADACDGATITFDMSQVVSPILIEAVLVIDKNLTIQGPTTTGLTINGSNMSRIFNVNAGWNLTFSNLTISGGQAAAGGGVNNLGNLTILNSTLTANTATSNGGAILTEGGVVKIINSTISGNNAGSGGGGGLYNGGTSQTMITNSTIAGNNEGIRHVSSNPLLLNNTIVARNPNCASCDEVDVFVDTEVPTVTIDPASSNNLIGVDTGVIGISNGTNGNQIGSAEAPVDPLLGLLANNGGPTFTHALNNFSPAADTGNNALALDQNNAALATDQRGTGFPRIDHGVVDIGAYEKTFVPPPPSADVGVIKLASNEESLADRDVVYTITLTNAGPDAAASVTLNDVLPGDLTFVSLSQPAGWVCTTPAVGANGTVNCTNASLAVGGSSVFTLTVHIPPSTPAGTEYHNVATVSSDTSDPESLNNQAAANTTVVSCLTNPAVTTNADSGVGSLRQAIIDACDGSVITFNMATVVSPITLTSDELAINKNLTITGPGANLLTISGNNASRVFNVSSVMVTMSGLTISQGLANASSSPANVGGGIYNSGNLTLNSCLVTANNAPVGGGIFNPTGGILNINNSTISGNTATGAGGGGGIANLTGGTLNLSHSTISSNNANGQGGGLINQNSTAVLINSTISGNTAGSGGDGGGILNSASSGGTATVALTNCTITGNTAMRGSAIVTTDLFNNAMNAETLIRNSLVGGNNGPNFFTSGTQGKVTDKGNNLDSDGTSGLVNGTNGNKVGTAGSPLNALLAPLANYGGPTQTHALLPGSPAIDAANNCVVEAAHCGDANIPQLTNDQRGFERQVNGTVDIGAFESRGFTISATSGTPQSTAFNTAFGAPLVATVSSDVSEPVNGGQVTFTAPGAGASATFTGGVTTINVALNASGQAGASATANDTVGGPYNVTATGIGVTGSAVFSLTNVKANQTITFGALANKTFGDPDFAVSATASSGLTVSLSSTGNCTVSSPSPGIAHITGAGSCTITASQGGNIDYNSAPSVPQSFTINKANQTITFNALPNKTFGDPDFSVSATSSSGLTVSFSATGSCTVSSPSPGTVQLTGAGSCTITASQPGNIDYNAAADVQRSFNIVKAASSTAVSSSVNPSDFNQSVTFTATVTGPSGTGTPSGTVQFKDSAVNLGAPVALNASGVAQFTTSTLTSGTYTITAEYSGDANFLPSTGALAGGQVVKAQPSLSINDVAIGEGNAGTQILNFTVTLSAASNLTVSVGYILSDGTAVSPGDYQATSGTLTFNPGETTRTIPVTINGDVNFEADETFTVNLSNPVNATISTAVGTATIQNDDALGGFIGFSQVNTSVDESTGIVTLTVTRGFPSFGQANAADALEPATVDYATDDTGASTNCAALNTGLASQRCDYTSVFGTLKFAAGETQKTINIPITLDAYNEGPEVFTVNLSNPTGGAVAAPSTATVTINDSASPTPNAIDDTTNFVRQQYRDFLNREADPEGLAFWKDNIDKCNDPARRPANQTVAQCIEVQRITTSAAFFLSIEFKQTGGMVRDFYVAALNRPATNNMPNFVEFMRDTQAIQKGVIVGQGNWQQILDANRTAFMNDFVAREEFVGLYPTTDTPAQYVDKLYLHAGVSPANPGERAAAIVEFGGAATAADPGARGRALLRVTLNAAFQAREANRAFVQIEYFGYLRRNPNDAPDGNFSGYNFWVNKLNQFNGDFLQAEMVKAFLSSLEYRGRFGP